MYNNVQMNENKLLRKFMEISRPKTDLKGSLDAQNITTGNGVITAHTSLEDMSSMQLSSKQKRQNEVRELISEYKSGAAQRRGTGFQQSQGNSFFFQRDPS